VVQCDAVRNSEMVEPFIGRWGEWRDREVSGEMPTSGAPITHRLLEEEATAHLFLFHFALEGDKLGREERRRAGERWRRLGELEVEEDPVGLAGPNCLATWPSSREKWHGPQEGMGRD
jgi:hypothetical protein